MNSIDAKDSAGSLGPTMMPVVPTQAQVANQLSQSEDAGRAQAANDSLVPPSGGDMMTSGETATKKEGLSFLAGDIVQFVREVFLEYRNARIPFETDVMEAWWNFQGRYQKNLSWRSKEGELRRSKIFIKLTAVKCHTAHAKLVDAIGPTLPYDLEPHPDIELGIPIEQVSEIIDKRKKIIDGKIAEMDLMAFINSAMLNGSIFGTMILKGPILVSSKKMQVTPNQIFGMPAQQVNPQLSPFSTQYVSTDVYRIDEVPWWEYFTDPNARSPKEALGEIHFRRMLPQEVRELAAQPGYFKEAVYIAANRGTLSSEDEDRLVERMGDYYAGCWGHKDLRIPVIEYQGKVMVAQLRNLNNSLPAIGAQPIYIPPDLLDEEYVEAIIVVAANNVLIKATVNQTGERQFRVIPFKQQPNTIYGTGPALQMRDAQKMVNSAARMIIDNKAFSGNGMFIINKDKIDWRRSTGEDGKLVLYPGCTVVIKGAARPDEAFQFVAPPDVTQGLQQLFEMFMELADEETGIPKYTQGETDSFLNKTATGMSMLMGQANVSLKTVLTNLDKFGICPIVEAIDNLLMTTGGYPPELQIPLKVKAQGTMSIVARELVADNIIKMLQVTGNPQDAVYVKRGDAIRAWARNLGLADFVSTDEEVQQVQQMIQQQQAQMIAAGQGGPRPAGGGAPQPQAQLPAPENANPPGLPGRRIADPTPV
jgi:hypothetical protein